MDRETKDKDLGWRVEKKETILKTRVYDVEKRHNVSALGIEGDYIVANAPDWVITIPVIEDRFVLVRQYRHGYGDITTELPGGVCEKGEDPVETAVRELQEETGYRTGKATLLGKCSPNPALFSNTLYVVLCENLEKVSKQNLDKDEVLVCLEKPVREVIEDFASGEYMHAYMGTALALYMRHISEK